ncbi:MAG: AAA family ATPase [Candidatus Schekmanbacteria bacterium]|nr:AAA family ATPase [Candidatus Schekmanbacteria bacterium]
MKNNIRDKMHNDIIQKEMVNFVQKYWGLASSPFDTVPNPNLFYFSTTHKEGILRIVYAIKGRKGAAMLTGEVGSGKSTVTRLLIQRLLGLNYDVALINNPTFSGLDFLREIIFQLGIESTNCDKCLLYRKFNERLLQNSKQGKDTVIFIDEAQAIGDMATFEELRMLLNFHSNDKFLLTLILVGQPNLRNMVAGICQFEQRVAVSYHLEPLPLVDTARYIIYRMEKCGIQTNIFTNNALKLIYQYTSGIPRLINHLCDMCLLSGCLSKAKKIAPDIVEYVISDRGVPIHRQRLSPVRVANG